MSKYGHNVRVYYEDTDAGGIVYYANYLKFLERARTEWLRQMGTEQDILLERSVGFVVKRVEMDNHLDDIWRYNRLYVQTNNNKSKRTTFGQCFNHSSLCYLSNMKPQAIPDKILGGFSRVI
jgi:acyl-CoA thioester hydrolase